MYPRRRRENGTTTVEAAVTLLAFLTILFGLIEAGRLINVQQTLTDAAREGARLAVAPASQTSTLPSAAEVQAEVTRFLDSANISGATIQVSSTTAVDGDTMTKVTVNLPYNVITTPMFSYFEVTLTGESVMRNETN